MSKAIEAVVVERQRQVSAEGYSLTHDDMHMDGALAAAAAAYATHASQVLGRVARNVDGPPVIWPWDEASWKPKTPRRDLVRAAALLVAEIERLDRAKEALGGSGDPQAWLSIRPQHWLE